MKIMKLGGAAVFFCLLNQLCHASTLVLSRPGHEEDKHVKLHTTVKPRPPVHIDGDLSDRTSQESQAVALSSGYNADEIIREIQASSKKSYLKNRLLVQPNLYKKIHDRDEGVIEKFRTEIAKLTPNPEDVSDGGGYTADYYPKSNKVIAYISDPV